MGRNDSAGAQGRSPVGPDYRLSHSPTSNFKQNETNTNQQNKQTQIQNLNEGIKNTGTSVLLWYTPKIKYPNSIHGSSDMTKPSRNKEL